jgi:hypothetical protein
MRNGEEAVVGGGDDRLERRVIAGLRLSDKVRRHRSPRTLRDHMPR